MNQAVDGCVEAVDASGAARPLPGRTAGNQPLLKPGAGPHRAAGTW